MQVNITGIGINTTVDVEDASTVADALAAAGQQLSGGLQPRVAGQVVGADVELSDGQTVTLVPPSVKLG